MLVKGGTDNKVHGANMESIWGRQDPDGPHVGPMNLAIWEVYLFVDYIGLENRSWKHQLLAVLG